MKPLNHCLNHYLERRHNDTTAPSWLLFHDTDEYMFPVDTTRTLSEELRAHRDTCCVVVRNYIMTITYIGRVVFMSGEYRGWRGYVMICNPCSCNGLLVSHLSQQYRDGAVVRVFRWRGGVHQQGDISAACRHSSCVATR